MTILQAVETGIIRTDWSGIIDSMHKARVESLGWKVVFSRFPPISLLVNSLVSYQG